MKLTTLKLTNFRGYRETVVVPIDAELTAFIGKNDIGKSTILEALEIFFNNKLVKIEEADFCVDADDNAKIEIACCFGELLDEINIDATNATSLSDECLLNADGELEIVKTFKRAKTPSAEVGLNANFPSNPEYQGILDKTLTELKKAAQDLGVWEQVPDQRKLAEIRKTIRESLGALNLEEQLVTVKKGDGKALWEKVQLILPLFALFKSDRASSDQDKEVQDPMKLAVDIALQSVVTDLERIQVQVQNEALEVANRTVAKLHEMCPELAEDLQPDFKESPKWASIFKLNLNSRGEIPLNKRGSGVRRLILLNFFRAEAERLKEEKQVSNIIFAVEEPETSQHPSNQQMILEALREIAESNKSQVLVTTHVPALAELLPLQSLRFIHRDIHEGAPSIALPSEETFKNISETLGVLPSQEVAEKAPTGAIVMVEGPSDVIFVRHLTTVLKEAGHLEATLEERNVIPLIAGGCGSLKHWVNLRLLQALNRPFLALLDSDKLSAADPDGGANNHRSVNDLRAAGVRIICTRKREAENYLCPSLIPGLTEIADYDDVKLLAADKKILEKKWPQMTADLILARDLYQSEDGQPRNELLELASEILALGNN